MNKFYLVTMQTEEDKQTIITSLVVKETPARLCINLKKQGIRKFAVLFSTEITEDEYNELLNYQATNE